MHPEVGPFPAFAVGWFLAIVLGGGGAVWLLRRAGVQAWQAGIVFVGLVTSVVIGSKLLYLAESWDQWIMNRTAFLAALCSAHMRLPGGFLLMIATTPALARLTGVRTLRLVDTFIPAIPLSILGVRAGCFLEGCCFGTPSSLPWAVRFPPYTAVYWWQVNEGLISPSAGATAPVHPLQLYFAVAGLLMFCVLASWQTRKRYDGEILLLFALLYFWSTWLLELLRANPHDFAREVTLAASIGVTAVLAVMEWRFRARAHLPARCATPVVIR